MRPALDQPWEQLCVIPDNGVGACAPSTERAGQHQSAVVAVAVIILAGFDADGITDDAGIGVDGDRAVDVDPIDVDPVDDDAVDDDTIADDDMTTYDDALIAITALISTITAMGIIISSPQASPPPQGPSPSLSPKPAGRHPASSSGVSCHLPMLPRRQPHAASPRGGQRGPATVPGGPGRASPGAGLVPKSSPGVGMRGA